MGLEPSGVPPVQLNLILVAVRHDRHPVLVQITKTNLIERRSIAAAAVKGMFQTECMKCLMENKRKSRGTGFESCFRSDWVINVEEDVTRLG
jgi:ABC-type Mn2+/Zn2+ transport system ATPase subunit